MVDGATADCASAPLSIKETTPLSQYSVAASRPEMGHRLKAVGAFALAGVTLFAVIGANVLRARPFPEVEEELSSNIDESSSSPNIFFIVIDDLGWNDIGYQSTEIENITPHIDALAEEGVKLSHYYSAFSCTPTRAALHTGVHWSRSGMWWEDIQQDSPWALPGNYRTMGEHFSLQGYATALVGKWNCGHANRQYWPTERGWDSFYGLLSSEYKNYSSHESTTVPSLDAASFSGWESYGDYVLRDLMSCEGRGDTERNCAFEDNDVYSTDLFADHARSVMHRHASGRGGEANDPLLLMLAYNGVHSTVSTPVGWGGPSGKENSADPEVRQTFIAALSMLDASFGRVVSTGRETGLLDDAVTIVMSDNGGHVVKGGNNWPLRGEKLTWFEGGVRVPCFVHSSRLPAAVRGTTIHALVQVTDWIPTILFGVLGASRAYATTGSDGEDFDGVDQWAVLRGERESAREEVVHGIFYLAYAEVIEPESGTANSASQTIGTKYIGTTNTSRERGRGGKRDSEDLYWLSAAIRSRNFKLITNSELALHAPPNASACNTGDTYRDYLYDLSVDPTEENNLIDDARYKSTVRYLRERLRLHYNDTLKDARYTQEDSAAYYNFQYTQPKYFVSNWTRVQREDELDFPKPALAETTFLCDNSKYE